MEIKNIEIDINESSNIFPYPSGSNFSPTMVPPFYIGAHWPRV